MSTQSIQNDTPWTTPNNRGEIADNNTTTPQITTDETTQELVIDHVPQITETTPQNHATLHITKQSVPEYIEDTIEELSAEEIRYTRLVAKGMSLTSAYRQAFPHKKKLGYDTIRRYAHELYAKGNIKSEVQSVRATQARLARLAEDRIEEVLTDGDAHVRGSRVPDVAMFMYDHANGKATIRQEITSKSISVSIDLTGVTTEAEN